MSEIANVVISLEPGGHEFPVPPMVAAYINRLQRENAELRARVDERCRATGLGPRPGMRFVEPAVVARERVGK